MSATEVLFYHFERQTLEQVLPILLEKSLSVIGGLSFRRVQMNA